MGYAITKILLYGIKLDSQNALLIDDYLSEAELPSSNIFRKLNEYSIKKGIVQKLQITPYNQHQCGQDVEVFHIDMLSDGADSRCDNLSYNEGFESYLGIVVCSAGYGTQDDFDYFLNNLPPEVINLYNTNVLPILEKYKIEANPEIKVIVQNW